MTYFFWLGAEAESLCDDDLPNEETIEADGFITVYFTGQPQPLPN